jgi:hypothetical protein
LATPSADSSPDRICLEQVRLPDLDAIATPSRLALRIGEKEVGPTLTYPIAGSFVQFLIESHGIEKFRALYEETPFKPLARSAGAPERWMKAYYGALTDLEAEWKSTIASEIATAHPHAQTSPRCVPHVPERCRP